MLISLDGNIIDTEDIYGISEISTKEEDFFSHSFTIHFFNRKKMIVKHDTQIYVGSGDNYIYVKIRDVSTEEYKCKNRNDTIEKLRNTDIYIQSKKDISDLRDQIISHWNKYKLDIPMLGLSKNSINLDC